MKRILFPVILLLNFFFASSAFAMHAYRSQNCKSTTHEFNYKGNYPIGGNYGISKLGQEDDVVALPLLEDYDSETPVATTLEDAEVVFTEVSSKVISKGSSSNDCNFDHEEWTSEKVVEINLISVAAAKNLGIKQGDQMIFTCSESTDFPNGNDQCN